MSLISGVDVAARRNLVGWLLTDECDITDPGTVTTTASGGTTIAGPTTTAGVECLVASGKVAATQRAFREFGEQATVDADHVVVFAHDVAIEPGWTVTWQGRTYTVIDATPVGTNAVQRMALIKRARGLGG